MFANKANVNLDCGKETQSKMKDILITAPVYPHSGPMLEESSDKLGLRRLEA